MGNEVSRQTFAYPSDELATCEVVDKRYLSMEPTRLHVKGFSEVTDEVGASVFDIVRYNSGAYTLLDSQDNAVITALPQGARSCTYFIYKGAKPTDSRIGDVSIVPSTFGSHLLINIEVILYVKTAAGDIREMRYLGNWRRKNPSIRLVIEPRKGLGRPTSKSIVVANIMRPLPDSPFQEYTLEIAPNIDVAIVTLLYILIDNTARNIHLPIQIAPNPKLASKAVKEDPDIPILVRRSSRSQREDDCSFEDDPPPYHV